MTAVGVPTFFLYGEPHRAVADGFLHVEHLDDRSRPSEWTIQPHDHADLAQIFVIASGGGVMRADTRALPFEAPAVLVVPAGFVHGFDWKTDSAGTVVTLAQSYVGAIVARHVELDAVFTQSAALPLDAPTAATMLAHAGALQRELEWSATGHQAAVEAGVTGLLVAVLRQLGSAPLAPSASPGQQAGLVASYRKRIGERFRLREPISRHAAALGTSETRLRAACARIAARSPAAMLDDRAMLEARRALLYTNLSIAEIGYAIGLGDPAYFSRFFTRHEGVSPGAYRKRAKDNGSDQAGAVS